LHFKLPEKIFKLEIVSLRKVLGVANNFNFELHSCVENGQSSKDDGLAFSSFNLSQLRLVVTSFASSNQQDQSDYLNWVRNGLAKDFIIYSFDSFHDAPNCQNRSYLMQAVLGMDTLLDFFN